VSGTYRATAIYGRVRDTEAMERSVDEVLVLGAEQDALDEGAVIGEGLAFGRDLANRSANDLYPERMAEVARELESDGCSVEILEPKEMERLGMGLLLGVGQGAAHEPRLIAVKLPGWEKGGDRRLAIVGKGVCFDSGGLSLKPADGMGDMKHDKSGAAAVIAAARTVARLAPDTPLMAVAPMVENMPGGNAQRPGDVVTSMSGQTIEVLNTDAEGRMVLADCLWYVQERFKPKAVINLATLTGAVMVALGKEHAGIFSNNDELAARLIAAGNATGEKLWRLPLGPKYDKMIDSKVADMKNTGGKWGGSISAAQFLQRFIKEGTPWAHLDIAGTAMSSPQTDINKSWGSGWGVRLLDALVAEHYES